MHDWGLTVVFFEEGVCVCPLGRERVYTGSWVVKQTDGGRDCKLRPNIHSSLFLSHRIFNVSWTLGGWT